MRADENWLARLGPTLVVAPHPDDESIGCGGLIASLARRNCAVTVVLVSDGTMSHPGSSAFSAAARRDLRSAEMREALALLGLRSGALHELGCADGTVPAPGEPGFERAVERLSRLIASDDIRTLVAPWRRDPHGDHRASNAIARFAGERAPTPPRLLEYPVWTEERGGPDDRPRRDEARAWQLDVTPVRALKRRAIAAHRSQCGGVIVDDPAGFTLSSEMIERATAATETYYEAIESPVLS